MTEPATTMPLVGVLALQGAFAEHQRCLEAVGCRTVQVRACLAVFLRFPSNQIGARLLSTVTTFLTVYMTTILA
jgi:hypothetical protein